MSYLNIKTRTIGFGWIVGTVSLAFVIAQIDVTIVNIALPQFQSSFHADVTMLQWVIDAYTIAFAALMLAAGSLSDLIGSRKIFQLGILIFFMGSVGCGIAWSAYSIIGFRVIQGLGSAMMIPSSLALLNQSFSHDKDARVRAVALWTAAGSVALAVGPVCGGLLIKLSNWRFIFFVNIPLCVAAFLMSFRLDSFRTGAKKSIDAVGQITWAFALTALIAIIIEYKRLGISSVWIWLGVAFTLLAFFLFLKVESTTKKPMLPLSLFKSSHFNVLLLLGGVINNVYYGTFFILSLYLQNVLKFPPLKAGFAFFPLTFGLLVTNLISGKFIGRYGPRPPILLGLFTSIAGFCALMFASTNTPYWLLSVPFFIIPAGIGLAVPAMTNGILASVNKEMSGTASAVLITIRQAAGAIGVATYGAIAGETSKSIVHGLTICSAISIVLCFAVFLLVIKYLNRR
jgi:DHA2 family methylenomycin A resistance protein-like MFS transporter